MNDHHGIKLLPSANTVNPVDIKGEVMVGALKCHVFGLEKSPSAKDFILLPRLRNMKLWCRNWTVSKAFCSRNLTHSLCCSVSFVHSLATLSNFQVYIGRNYVNQSQSPQHQLSTELLQSIQLVSSVFLSTDYKLFMLG